MLAACMPCMPTPPMKPLGVCSQDWCLTVLLLLVLLLPLQDSGGKSDGTVYRMVCPTGYASVGDVWGTGYTWQGVPAPQPAQYACVHDSCVEPCGTGPADFWKVWSSEGMGVASNRQITVWGPSLASNFGATTKSIGTTFAAKSAMEATDHSSAQAETARMLCLKPSCVKIGELSTWAASGAVTYTHAAWHAACYTQRWQWRQLLLGMACTSLRCGGPPFHK